MEEVFAQAFRQQQEAYEAQLAEKDQREARLRQLWASDTSVSDGTLFLYRAWLDDYISNPAIAQAVNEAAGVAHECPPLSRVNRIACLMFMQERMQHANLRSELAAANRLLEERDATIKRWQPLDKILAESNHYQTSVMQLGKRVIDLEQHIEKLNASLLLKTQQAGAVVREEYDRRRNDAHDALNKMHVDLMTVMSNAFHASKDVLNQAEKVTLHDELVHHLEQVRLLLLRT